ncbi:MAG: ThiF family adenylyltransferase [Hyphomicrobiales bacterium]|nr:ThiF family adenylyltransferase [Hyphomicrobiales bacterium]
MTRSTSVAMTATIHDQLCDHLLRDDGQEDLCMAIYRPSTGRSRTTALISAILLPNVGERTVHGNVTFTGDYVLRASEAAAAVGGGVVVLHSHPGGHRWQAMSGPDRDAERSYANLAREITGLPLVGMTLAGSDRSWSARHWDQGAGQDVEAAHANNVRVIGPTLALTWNDELAPPPPATARLRRTVSCWGPETQADLARRRVLVVGAGSVGLDIAVRLAASGVESVTVMDFDTVEEHNLDRLIGATGRDVALRRPKTYVAHREMSRNATAADPHFEVSNHSICEPEGLAVALDHDLVFCCVDRPWPRAVLNSVAYSDLIALIDGGIAIDTMPSGTLRNATWRSHVVAPGRPCLVCNHQLDPARVPLDIDGLLDDPAYIAAAGNRQIDGAGQNVAVMCVSAAASMLAQYTSLSAGPGGFGDPGPLQYLLSTHELAHLDHTTSPHCPYEASEAHGDLRIELTGEHATAEHQRQLQVDVSTRVRLLQWLDDRVSSAESWIDRVAGRP